MLKITSEDLAEGWRNMLMKQMTKKSIFDGPVKELTKWEKFKLKVNRILNYRLAIVNKNDYCGCDSEDY